MSERSRGRVIWGLVLVAVGVAFLLEELGVPGADDLLGTYWPLILVGLGTWGLVTSQGRNLGALLLTLLGVTLQLQELDVLDGDVWDIAWPVAIIVVGAWLILRRPWYHERSWAGGASTQEGDVLKAFALMSGRNERIMSRAWRGGEATAIMGGVEVHLDDAQPVEGGARLQATAIMGGIEIFVPRTWEVTVNATPLLGGIDDKRRPRSTAEVERNILVGAVAGETTSSPGAGAQPGASEGTAVRPTLRIDATAILGGIEIKDA